MAGLSIDLLMTEADLIFKQAALMLDIEGPGLSSISPESSKSSMSK